MMFGTFIAAAAWAAACNRAMTAGGVAAWVYSPIMLKMRKPGSPCSATVGTLGSMGLRSGEVTASPFSWPDCTCGSRLAMPSISTSTLPAIMSVITGPAPRYGTCVAATPARFHSSSAPRWLMVPLPAEP